MARSSTKTPSPNLLPPDQQIEQLLLEWKFNDALAVLHKQPATNSGAIADALIRRVYRESATHYADVDNAVDFNRVMKAAKAYPSTDPNWPVELAALATYGGQANPTQSLFPESTDTPQAQAIIAAAHADRAIRIRKKDWLPTELHAGFDTIIAAFTAYEAGQDEKCREILDGIGVRSPFLDWKLLIRGLIAYTAQEDARAIENWSRLQPLRLPARLAMPMRSQIDPTLRQGNSPAQTIYDAQFQKLHTGPIISTLRLIQNNLNHAKNHATAFRYAEEIVPRWKKQSPAMVQRLANCFYQAILRHGEPTDLPRFRRTFGPPLDDPSFFRLEADVMESCNALDVSVEKWIKYSQWLETKPAGWPLSVLVRLRAMIHLRISNILQDLPPDDSVLAPTKPKRKPASAKAQHRQPEVDPLYHLQLAATLSPDWIEPQLAWGGTLFQLGRLLEAEAVLQAALNWHPKSVAILKSLVLLSHKSQRWDAKLDYLARAIAADPLNPVFRSLAVRTHQTYARQLGLAGNFTEAEQHLQQSLSLSQPQETAPIQTMMAVLARKVGRTADAENWSQQALANTSNNLTVALIMSVESQLFKLKPADKRPIDQKLKELLATNHPQAHAVTTTIKCLVMYREDGVTYRGQTTHEKTLLALALKAAQSDTASPEIVFENLAEVARYIENRTAVTKILRQLEYRFPENPVFPFIQAEWLLEQLGPDRSRYQIAEMLDTAYDLAKTSSEARHQNLLSRIEELLEKVRPQSFMDIFFD